MCVQGTFLVTQAASRAMIQQRLSQGSIVNISSIAGKVSLSYLYYCHCHLPVVVQYFCIGNQKIVGRPTEKQEKPTNCRTKGANVLANFLAGKL